MWFRENESPRKFLRQFVNLYFRFNLKLSSHYQENLAGYFTQNVSNHHCIISTSPLVQRSCSHICLSLRKLTWFPFQQWLSWIANVFLACDYLRKLSLCFSLARHSALSNCHQYHYTVYMSTTVNAIYIHTWANCNNHQHIRARLLFSCAVRPLYIY